MCDEQLETGMIAMVNLPKGRMSGTAEKTCSHVQNRKGCKRAQSPKRIAVRIRPHMHTLRVSLGNRAVLQAHFKHGGEAHDTKRLLRLLLAPPPSSVENATSVPCHGKHCAGDGLRHVA